jgi:hypothetical protein
MLKKNVFKLWQSMDDYNETQLYGKLNEAIDWQILRDIAEGRKQANDYQLLHLTLKSNKILKKDLIQAPAGVHFISERFKNYFDAEVFEGSVLLPATINDTPYYVWVFLEINDCLDRAESQLEDFKYDENGDQIPHKFVFDSNKIKDNRFFKLSDEDNELYYCDEIVGRKILASDLNLMAQPLVYEEQDLRKRVVYNNPNVGVQFEEPKNWHLECAPYKKIKEGKKLTDKDWEIKFKANELEFGLLSMYRRQLLISTNSLQKGEIHIGLTKRTAEAYFEYQSTLTPIDFTHPDVKFEARIHEYEWQKILVTPFKEGLNLYVIVVNRTHYKTDEIYKNEALEVLKNIRFNLG